MKPILILAHPGDRLALHVCAFLQRQDGPRQLRDPRQIKLVSAEAIALSTGWDHRQTIQGTTTQIRLADGTLLDDRFGVVFNRLQQIDLPQFAGADPVDRDYAQAEMQALVLSWLSSLSCPVINPASPQGLGGARRTHAQWMQLAHTAGLPMQAYHFTTNPRRFSPPAQPDSTLLPFRTPAPASAGGILQLEQITWPQVGSDPTFFLEAVTEERISVLVAGDWVVGMSDHVDVDGCKRLARLAGCPLLEIALARRTIQKEWGWVVCGVNPFPTGEAQAVIRAIADLLEQTCETGFIGHKIND